MHSFIGDWECISLDKDLKRAETSLSDCWQLYQHHWVAGVFESLHFEPLPNASQFPAFDPASTLHVCKAPTSPFLPHFPFSTPTLLTLASTGHSLKWLQNHTNKTVFLRINLLRSFKSVTKKMERDILAFWIPEHCWVGPSRQYLMTKEWDLVTGNNAHLKCQTFVCFVRKDLQVALKPSPIIPNWNVSMIYCGVFYAAFVCGQLVGISSRCSSTGVPKFRPHDNKTINP